jgi:uncharacterized repeat protein (TIGR02543 family)
VTVIGKYAFAGCDNLASVIFLGNVTTIEEYAFSLCINLTSINLPSSLTTVNYQAFGASGFFRNSPDNSVVYADKWVAGFKGSVGGHVTLRPDTVGIIDAAFYYCITLTSIIIPTGVTRIPQNGFGSNPNLAAVYLHNGVTSIGNGAFSFCPKLLSLTIPSSVVTMGGFIVSSSPNTTVYIQAASRPSGWDASWNGNSTFPNISFRPVAWGCTMANDSGYPYVVSFTKTSSSYSNQNNHAVSPPNRLGHTFNGWFTGQNGTGTHYASLADVPTNATVHAHWTDAGNGGYTGGAEERFFSVKAPVSFTALRYAITDWFSKKQ